MELTQLGKAVFGVPEMSGVAKRELMGENSMIEIMRYFGVGVSEFKAFWETLSEEEKFEFKQADLSKG